MIYSLFFSFILLLFFYSNFDELIMLIKKQKKKELGNEITLRSFKTKWKKNFATN